MQSLRTKTALYFCALASLVLWSGGFAFYAGIVIPTGQQILGSHFSMGLITQKVSLKLNLVGSIALVFALLYRLGRRQSRFFTLALVLFGLLQVALFVLHPYIDSLLENYAGFRSKYELFYGLHRTYLIISTIMWLLSIYILVSMIKEAGQQ